jgi:hypothetical protein
MKLLKTWIFSRRPYMQRHYRPRPRVFIAVLRGNCPTIARAYKIFGMQRRSAIMTNGSATTGARDPERHTIAPQLTQRISPVSFQLPGSESVVDQSTSHYCLCSNCNLRPVAEVTNCFVDWCHKCDASLWATRPSASSESDDLIDPQLARRNSPVSFQLSGSGSVDQSSNISVCRQQQQ